MGPGFVSQAEADVQVGQAVPSLQSGSRMPASQPDGGFELHPPVLLMEGAGPFVISTKSEREVIARLGASSVLSIWGGPIITVLSAYIILGRLVS